MKTCITLIFSLFCTSFLVAQSNVNVPAGESVVLRFSDHDAFEATLKNKGFKSVHVAVVSQDTKKQLRGFGLDKLGKAKVMVEGTSDLVLENKSNKDVVVNVTDVPVSMDVFKKPKNAVNFTLRNNSQKSIPLIIPTVMNPNLSPQSNSGVTLKMGQEIFFKAKGKKQVLLIVDDTIQEDDVIDVASLLSIRKKELGIK